MRTSVEAMEWAEAQAAAWIERQGYEVELFKKANSDAYASALSKFTDDFYETLGKREE